MSTLRQLVTVALVIAVIVALVIAASAGVATSESAPAPEPALRIAVIGDSLCVSDLSERERSRYRAAGHPMPRSWVELVQNRTGEAGRLLVDDEVGSIRSGLTLETILSEGIAARGAKALASGRVDMLALCVGHDDFGPLMTRRRAGHLPTPEEEEAFVAVFRQRYATILDQFADAGAGRILLFTLAGWHRTPFFRTLNLGHYEFRAVARLTAAINTAIHEVAAARGLVVVSMGERFENLFHGSPRIRHLGLVTSLAGTDSTNAFRPDGMHPNTAISALIADVVVETLARDGHVFPDFTDDEIRTLAGLPQP